MAVLQLETAIGRVKLRSVLRCVSVEMRRWSTLSAASSCSFSRRYARSDMICDRSGMICAGRSRTNARNCAPLRNIVFVSSDALASVT